MQFTAQSVHIPVFMLLCAVSMSLARQTLAQPAAQAGLQRFKYTKVTASMPGTTGETM